jgi:hypothetical protein
MNPGPLGKLTLGHPGRQPKGFEADVKALSSVRL